MLTPYLKMTNGQIEVADGLSLNLALMDEALDSGRGYYVISDLVKMNLDYHAIEVGTVNIGSLTMESEFGNNQEKEINGFDLISKNISTDSDEIKVYDVILAGVCR